MSEIISMRLFIEKWLISCCLVKMHVLFGLPDATNHIFVKRARELQAIELDCEICHDPEGWCAPAEAQERLHILQPPPRAGPAGWYLYMKKRPLLLPSRARVLELFWFLIREQLPLIYARTKMRTASPHCILLQGSGIVQPPAMRRGSAVRALKAWVHLGTSICVQCCHLTSNKWPEQI